MSNLNYWAARLTPLHDPTPGYGAALEASGPVDAAAEGSGGGGGAGAGGGDMGKEVVFVACNRVGTEEGEWVEDDCLAWARAEGKLGDDLPG